MHYLVLLYHIIIYNYHVPKHLTMNHWFRMLAPIYSDIWHLDIVRVRLSRSGDNWWLSPLAAAPPLRPAECRHVLAAG